VTPLPPQFPPDPQDLLTSWWESALIDEGVPSGSEILSVDLREVRNGPHAAKEVIKYLFKDLDAQGRKVPAHIYAEVYKAFDGRRSTQCSSKFMQLAEKRTACECGSDLPRRVRLRKQRDRQIIDALVAEIEKPLVLP
jgi:hypothetical protein